MKNLMLILITTIIPFLATAQQKNIEAFYEKYAELENVTNINMNGTFLKMTCDSNDENIFNKITNLRVMVMEKTNQIDYRDLKTLRKDIRHKGFEDLIKVRDGQAQVDIMLREKDDLITNVLIIVNDVDGFVLLSLEGLFSLKDLKNWDIDVEGSEHLKKVVTSQKYDRA